MRYDLVSIVAAPRGLPALRRLLAELPAAYATPVLCLVQATDRLVEDLQAHTRLRVQWAEADQALEPGTVYLSRPGTSIVCRPGGLLSITPFGLESAALNPIDQFLASAAGCHGERLLAVVLAGFEYDGAGGAEALRRRGSTLAILDRATADYWGVAEPMVRAGNVARTLTVAELGAALRTSFTSQDLLRCVEIQIALGALLDEALVASGTRMGHIARHDAGAGALRIVVGRGMDLRFLELFNVIPPGEDTACGRVLLTGAPAVIPDVLGDERCARQRAAAEAFGYRGEEALPLFRPRGRTLAGTLATLHAQPLPVDLVAARDLDRLAADAGRLLSDFR